MNLPFAQQDLGEIIVPLIVAAIYFISYVIKGVGEKKPAQAKKPPAPPIRRPAPPRVDLPPSAQLDIDPVARPQKAPPAPTAQQEMEKLLRDLGVRDTVNPAPRSKSSPPPIPQQQRRPKPQKSPKQPPQQRAKSTLPSNQLPSQQRELHSQLENRHANTVHSGIENKHLEAHLRPTATAPQSTSTPATSSLKNLLSHKDALRQAFMLSIVLGPPHALRDEPEKI